MATSASSRRAAPAANSRAARSENPLSVGGSAWVLFGALLLALVGSFNVVIGIAAIAKGDLFVQGRNAELLVDLTAYGWVFIAVGVAQVATCFALFTGSLTARVWGVSLLFLNAIAQLGFLPRFPVWSVIVIALDVIAIWAIVVHGAELKTKD